MKKDAQTKSIYCANKNCFFSEQTHLDWRKKSILYYLVDTTNDGPHGGVARSIDCAAVVSWAPTCWVDVDQVGLVTHGVGFNQISHVGLIQHANTLNNESRYFTYLDIQVYCGLQPYGSNFSTQVHWGTLRRGIIMITCKWWWFIRVYSDNKIGFKVILSLSFFQVQRFGAGECFLDQACINVGYIFKAHLLGNFLLVWQPRVRGCPRRCWI